MIDDARNTSDGANLEAEVCIIGAGAAGITLGNKWAATTPYRKLVDQGYLLRPSDARTR